MKVEYDDGEQTRLYYDKAKRAAWVDANWDEIPKIENPQEDEIVFDNDLNWCCVSKVLDGGRRIAVFTMDDGKRKDRKPESTTAYRKPENITTAWSNYVYPEYSKKI